MMAGFMEAALAGLGAVLVIILILVGLAWVLMRPAKDETLKQIEKWRDGK